MYSVNVTNNANIIINVIRQMNVSDAVTSIVFDKHETFNR